MRILVVSKFYPPVLGGVEVTVKELCEEFVRRGHEVTAVVMTKGSAAEESLNGVRVLRFPVDARWLGGLNRPVQSYLSKELDPGRFDIVHVHNFHILLSFQAAMMCRLRSMPYVFSPHYHGKGHTAARDLLFQTYKRVGRVGLEGARAITCASEYERQKLLGDFPSLSDRASVISPGIAKRTVTGARRRERTLLFVGRLMRYKGLDHVLRAMDELAERNIAVRLRVVGTGPDEAEIRSLVSTLDLEEHVSFLGEVGEEELSKEYAEASCLILLSEAEAYGLVVAEALASGTPCIVAKAAALTEFASEPGCFGADWPPDPMAVADLIVRVLEEAERIKVGPFSQKISYWPEVAGRYLELYQTILRSGTS